jgi:hypothetical protein
MKHTRLRVCTATAVAVLLIGVGAHRADAGKSIKIKIGLSATGVDQDASGQVQAQIVSPKSGMRANLDLKARRLDPNTTYQVLLNGVPVGTLTTTPGGNARARFSTLPRRKDQLLGADPRGMQIEVRNSNGDGVLETTVPDNGMDPTKIPCCIAQSGGSNEQPECEDLTADACTAAGGVASGASSCLPNPCEGANPPPQDNVVCCTPEDNGAECETRSVASCSARGGINLGAGSCDPNPCASTTPANPDTVQCCLTDQEETECEHRTADRCAAQGGTNMGPGSCKPNPCAAQLPADAVRCCLAKDSGGAECEQRTADQCTTQGGTNAGPGTCDASVCGTNLPPTSGGDKIRCCVPQGGGDNEGPECEQRTADQCTAQGGTNVGTGSCEPNPCS